MTISRLHLAARNLGMIAVIAAVAVAGYPRHAQAAAPEPAVDTPTKPALDKSVVGAKVSLKVTVSLSPKLAKKVAPDDVVFIFARAAQGPRMPLAIVRKQVKDLPVTVVLDDNHGMSPEMTLSSVPEVVVVARVSKSGMATPQAGDLEGMSPPVKGGNHDIAISINRVLPGY